MTPIEALMFASLVTMAGPPAAGAIEIERLAVAGEM
jgi:hypothetical protein